jgi:PPOX class probable F420-dependent enzyme
VELSAAMQYVRAHRQGALTTIRRDGRPQISNIVYTVGADDTIRISVTDTRAKARNLRRDPRASLYVCREDFWAYVVIDATVDVSEVVTDPHGAVADELVDLYRGVAGEHDDWEDYRASLVRDGRLVLRLTPVHAYGMLRD